MRRERAHNVMEGTNSGGQGRGRKLRLGFQSDVGDAADEVVGGGCVFFDGEDFEGGGRIVGAED